MPPPSAQPVLRIDMARLHRIAGADAEDDQAAGHADIVIHSSDSEDSEDPEDSEDSESSEEDEIIDPELD